MWVCVCVCVCGGGGGGGGGYESIYYDYSTLYIPYFTVANIKL